MKNFEFYNPVRVFFGKGETDRVGKECRKYGKRILLSYGGKSIHQSGLYDRVKKNLEAENLEVFELSGIQPNPRITSVRKGVEICKKEKINLILAVGGGSVIDCSKIIGAGAFYGGDPWDFFTKKAQPTSMLPLGTILTLAATGTEMNHNAVVTNDETGQKWAVVDPHIFPTFSILDPENTITVPRDQTVNGIVDMIVHVFEQYFHSTPETLLQDHLSEGIMQTIIETTPCLLAHLGDYDARATIMWCGTLALNHLISTGVEGDWATHNIQHELSAIYDIAHGAGLAIIFPQWMKYVLDAIPGKMARFAEKVWNIPRNGKTDGELALAGIERTRQWFHEIGAPVSLGELQIGSERLEEMARNAISRGPLGTTKKLGESDVLQILKMSLS
ncbi:MAG: iron-containing alcohol dehydrogenase [Atribacterota bacterium]